MEKINIRLGSPVIGKKYLISPQIVEEDDKLIFYLKYGLNNLTTNDIVTFERIIYGNNGDVKHVFTRDVKITRIDEENNFFETENIKPVRLNIDAIFNNDGNQTIIWFKENHEAFYQDGLLNMGQKVVFYDKDGGEHIYDFKIPYLTESYVYNNENNETNVYKNRSCVDEDFLTEINREKTYDENQWKITYEYSFLPDSVRNNGIIIENFDLEPKDIAYATMKFNPYYYYTVYKYEEIEGTNPNAIPYNDMPDDSSIGPNSPEYITVPVYTSGETKIVGITRWLTYGGSYDTVPVQTLYKKVDSGIKNCFLYNYDTLWGHFNESFNEKNVYKNFAKGTKGNCSIVYVNDYFWNTNVLLGNEVVNSTFGVNNESLLNSIEDSVVAEAPFIDMERIKYVPVVSWDSNSITFANEINLYFHFLKREKLSDIEYVDGWGVRTRDEDNSDTPVWWNGYNLNNFDSESFSSFVENHGKESDLLGYLDFTDNDVYYRKKKVSQSFVRLSFYNSNDPVKAKLLYYSTVFLDSTELFGNYIKLKNMYPGEDIDKVPHVYDEGALTASDERNFVFANTNPRLDSHITITGEYDRMRSAEGFNLYLFKDDAPEIDETKDLIYMKVEFNHAGNGQTIPMILWPKVENDSTTYKNLTLKESLKALFIPVKIRKAVNNGKVYYIYFIEGCSVGYNGYDRSLDLVLFEPKITAQEDNAE